MLRDLTRREPLLMRSAWAYAVCALICGVLMLVDDQQILGISRWIKPAKFFLSATIFMATAAWMLSLFDRPVPRVRGLIALAMFMEMVLITMQSVRGKRSHFNFESPIEIGVFNAMGIFILINTIAVAMLLWQYAKNAPPHVDRALVWGIRLGLAVFLAGSLEAGFMLARAAHTVGAPDGGAGLPFVNWSRSHGDLRVAHFLGLHALQAIPLAALVLRRVALVFAFAAGYVAIMVWLVMAALAGRPLI